MKDPACLNDSHVPQLRPDVANNNNNNKTKLKKILLLLLLVTINIRTQDDNPYYIALLVNKTLYNSSRASSILYIC